MLANIDRETGIRYGVVALNSLADWAFDEFFYQGTNLTSEAAYASFREDNPEATEEDEQEFWDCYESDEEEYELKTDDGLELLLSYLGGGALVWVCKSPHTTYARECSPCVPNAGDLDSLDSTGVRCYTLPEEWFQRS